VEDSAPEGEVCTEDRSSPAEVGLIMATMPDPKARGYFGPRRVDQQPYLVRGLRGGEQQVQVRSQLEQEPTQEEGIVSQHSIWRLTFE
jgi:hypothetical protein